MTKVRLMDPEAFPIGTQLGYGDYKILLDDKGFHYRGETIKDAGKAYKAFMEFLNHSKETV